MEPPENTFFLNLVICGMLSKITKLGSNWKLVFAKVSLMADEHCGIKSLHWLIMKIGKTFKCKYV